MKSWAALGSRDGDGNLEGSGVEIPRPRRINKTDEANQLHESYTDQVVAKHKQDNPVAAALWARAPEKEAKFALVHACACGFPEDSPMITGESIRWAKRVVNHSVRWMLWAANIQDEQTIYLKQKQAVLDKIETGMNRSQVTRRTQFLKRKDRADIISDLQETGLIRVDEQGLFIKVRFKI